MRVAIQINESLQKERAKLGPKVMILLAWLLWIVPILGIAVGYTAIMQNRDMRSHIRMFFAVIAFGFAVAATAIFFTERDAKARYEERHEQDVVTMQLLLQHLNETKVDRPTDDAMVKEAEL